ncbi:MAG: winged helix-turn-helix domain-containing protein [Woeseiaceae bacterium]|nr:winged helix-turn-helix domain-containing protein [Woeseiaceae bacterium]
MPTQQQLDKGFRIGDWEVLPARHVLRRGEQEITPEPKVWGVLMSLARRGGDVVTRDELVDEVWGGRATADEPINRCISQLRKHLGDKRPYRYIRPVTGSGYLLHEPIVLLDDSDAAGATTAPEPRRLWPFVMAVAVVAVVAVIVELLTPDGRDIRSIVVLPFENVGGDPQEQYIAAGFREELAATLRRIENFSVKTSRNAYSQQSARQIGTLFDVDSVLRGHVQRIDDKLRVRYELSRARDNEVLAADGITDSIENLFAMQERLAQRLVGELVGESSRTLVSASEPSNWAAYQSYLQGTYVFERRTGRNLRDAIALFERTIELDPSFGPAYLQLATATALMPAYLGADVRASNARAIDIVERGIAVDESIKPAAGAVLGFVYHSRKEWTKSEMAYEQAVNADVVDPNAYNWYSRMLASVGRLDAALAQALEAWRMDRDNSVINSRVAMTYFWLGDADNARAYFDLANRLGAEGTTHLLGYALFLASVDDIDKAREVARQAASQAGLSADSIDAVLSGIEDPALAQSALDAVNRTAATAELTPQVEVVARTLLGDIDGALQVAALLEQPGEAFEMDLLWIPQFLPLRQHPGFLDLLEDLGVPEYWDLKGCRFVDARVECDENPVRDRS